MPSTLPRAPGALLLLLLACEATPAPTPAPAPPAPAPRTAPQVTPSASATPDAEPPPPIVTFDEAAGLHYREVVLGSTDPAQPLPMLVAIHGLGDAPDNFRHLLDHFPEPARLILPRGLEPTEGGGWSWFPIRARDPDVEALAAGIATAATRIAAGLRELQARRPTIGKPIVTGFSQGGMLTFTLAVHHPDVVGHAIAVGGWLPPPLWPEAKAKQTAYPPLFALHGTADQAVVYEPTQRAIEALKALGFSAELTSYEGVGHMIPPPMRRDLHDHLIDAVHAERRRKSP